jgi:hypothetical protein
VEVIISGVLLSILLTGVVTVMGVYTRETTRGTATLLMQKQYETVIEEIGKKARESSAISDYDCAILPSADVTTNEVVFCREDSLIGKFKISESGILMECVPAGGTFNWQEMHIGGQPISINSGSFFISNNHSDLTIRMSLKKEQNGHHYILPERSDRFSCRNH